MADTKKQVKTAKVALPEKAEDLEKMIAELREQNREEFRSLKNGTLTNVHAAKTSRRQIARALTKLNQIKKEGERS